MKLSTRLLLPLLATVVLVMLLYGSWALRQREASLVADAARETRVYAAALVLAVERALGHGEPGGVQEIVERVGREPTIHGVVVYDPGGLPAFRSAQVRSAAPLDPPVVLGALSGGVPVELERTMEDVHVYSVLRPLRDDAGEVVGALEVIQPLTFLAADMARVRQRYLLNTLTLSLALVVLVVVMVRRFVSRPLEEFSAAVQALGAGQLQHRLDVAVAGGELAEVAEELNRMAERLECARAELLREVEERLSLERRLRHSERLAAMGELAAGVAHQIAAPLHVIRGRTDLLLDQGGTGAGRRNLDIISQQIDRITGIVRGLLDFARRREPRAVPTDLVEVLRGVADLLEDEVQRRGAALTWEGPPSLLVEGDPDLLHQVFLNVLINALQAMEETPRDQRRIHVRFAGPFPGAAGPRAEVEVRDGGPGVRPEDRERIFEPFFTTKAGSRGTGLGLSVARALVQDHGGTMEVASTAPAPAVFRVELPVGPVTRPDVRPGSGLEAAVDA